MIKFEIVDKPHIQYEQTQFKLPVRATMHSAGYDFYSPIDVNIEPNSSAMIWTNIKAKFDSNIVLLITVTSGMGKRGVMLCNTIGVIDCDYYGNINNDGNIGIRLYNYGTEPYVIKTGDKIGQGLFLPFLTTTDEEEITNVRVGGFGSTDKK